MSLSRPQLVATVCVALTGLWATQASAQETTAHGWLDKMAGAVKSTSYEGTVIRIRGGNFEALKVARQITDGVIREKVAMQDGNGREIIRIGNEVRSILPDEKSVLVEDWDDQSKLFSSLPSSDFRFGSEYDPSIVSEEGRVAGRKAVELAIRAHDEYRYTHRIWLDIETGFPLQRKLEDSHGDIVEHEKFAEISLDQEIQGDALAPTTSTENFQWFAQPKRKITHTVDSPWQSHDLPSGFRAVSAHEEKLAGREHEVIHILYSDGLANVSVFIEPKGDAKFTRRSRMGASNSYSAEFDSFIVTAVGEVPAATVEKIAISMRPN